VGIPDAVFANALVVPAGLLHVTAVLGGIPNLGPSRLVATAKSRIVQKLRIAGSGVVVDAREAHTQARSSRRSSAMPHAHTGSW
jgi:hypothetical protein